VLLQEREDQKKWMRNLRSKYLNDRSKTKPIYERAEDIINAREYRIQQEKIKLNQKALDLEQQHVGNWAKPLALTSKGNTMPN